VPLPRVPPTNGPCHRPAKHGWPPVRPGARFRLDRAGQLACQAVGGKRSWWWWRPANGPGPDGGGAPAVENPDDAAVAGSPAFATPKEGTTPGGPAPGASP
jgi:hypothetical protein